MVKTKLYKHKRILFIYSFVLACFTSNLVSSQTHIGTTTDFSQSFGDNWSFTPTTGSSPCAGGTHRIMQFTFTAGASSVCIYNGSSDYISVHNNFGVLIRCFSNGNEIIRNLTVGNTYRLYFYGNISLSGGSTLAWIRNSAGTYSFAKVDSLKLIDVEKKYTFFSNYRPDTISNTYYYMPGEMSSGDTISRNSYAVARSKGTTKIYRHYYTKEIELNNFAWSGGSFILQGLPDGVSLGSAFQSFYLSQHNKSTYVSYGSTSFATNYMIDPSPVSAASLLVDTLALGVLTKSTDEIFGLTHPLKSIVEEIPFSNYDEDPSFSSIVSRVSKGANELIFSYNNVANSNGFIFDSSGQSFSINQTISSYTALGNPASSDSTRYIKNVVSLPAPHSFYSINVRNNKCLNEPNSLVKIKFKYPKNITNIILEQTQSPSYYPAGTYGTTFQDEYQFNSNPAFIQNINLLSPAYANISNIVLHQDSVSFELLNLPKGVYRITAVSTYTMNALKKEEVEFYFRVENDPYITIANVQKTNLTCPNVNNGVVEVLINGGWGIYDVELMNSQGSQTIKTFSDSVLHNYRWAVFDSLASGNFNLFVKNDPISGCSDQLFFNDQLTAPDPFIFNKTNTNYSCFNSPSAQINISPVQGTPPYTFNLQNSLNTTTWTNTLATTTLTTYNITDEAYYRLIAVDANLCTYTSDTTFFDRPDTLKINSVTVSDIKCLGEQGKLLLNKSGGTPPYQQRYTTNAWSSESPFGDTTLLGANTYEVKLIDANLCEVTSTISYTITEPTELLTISLSKKEYNGRDLSCFGSSDGEVTLSAGGGNGGSYPNTYEFNENGGTYVSTPVFSGLGFGTYTYSVRDNRGCIVSTYTVLQTTPVLTATTSAKQNVICFSGNDGSITTLANGGTAPYRFVINTSDTKYNASDYTFTDLLKGLYTIQVTDTNNCQRIYTDSIIALNPAMVTSLTQQKEVSCFGENTGFAKTTTTGGIMPYAYSWNNGAITDSIYNVTAGNYSITVTDQQACSSVLSLTIHQPTAVQVSTNAYLSCNSNSSGIVSINALGGTPPFVYKLDTDTFFTANSIFKQLNVGNYIVSVKDSHNCIATGSAVINETLSAPQPIFMASTFSQQSDTLVLIDISEPRPDSLVWEFADSIIYKGGNMFAPQVVFTDTGSHVVTMHAFYDGCEIIFTKAVRVNKYDSLLTQNASNGIKSLVVSPNPNDGNFTITTELYLPQNFAIFIYNQTGVEYYRLPFTNSNYQNVSITMPSDISSGEYIVWVVSELDAKHFSIVINK